MLSILLAILAAFSAILGFFYQKDGEREPVRGLGVVLFLVILLFSSLSIFEAWRSVEGTKTAKREAAENKVLSRKIASTLMLEYLDFNAPFDFAILGLSVWDAELSGTPPSPFGKREHGLFDKGTNGDMFAEVEFDVGEMELGQIRLINENDTVIAERRYFVSEPDYKWVRYRFDAEGNCEALNEGACKYFDRDNADYFFEAIAAADGHLHHGVRLRAPLDKPSLTFMSHVLQSYRRRVGGFKYIGGEKNLSFWKKWKLEKFVKAQNFQLRLHQSFRDPRLKEQCVYDNVVIVKLEPKRERDEECSKDDICFGLYHKDLIDVIPCQVSQI